MKAVLKNLFSLDIDHLKEFLPENEGDFGLELRAMFGPDNGEGEESFDIFVCSPLWLASKVEKDGIVIGRHYLIVDDFDIDEIQAFLKKYADGCSGKAWNEVAQKLARIGRWEFEDYRSYINA